MKKAHLEVFTMTWDLHTAQFERCHLLSRGLVTMYVSTGECVESTLKLEGCTFSSNIVPHFGSKHCSWRHGGRKILCRQFIMCGNVEWAKLKATLSSFGQVSSLAQRHKKSHAETTQESSLVNLVDAGLNATTWGQFRPVPTPTLCLLPINSLPLPSRSIPEEFQWVQW